MTTMQTITFMINCIAIGISISVLLLSPSKLAKVLAAFGLTLCTLSVLVMFNIIS